MDRYEFKKYLLAKVPDTRQEELIFWKNRIPMPVDLVYQMYDERAEMLCLYADHLLTAYLFAYSAIRNSEQWVEEFQMQPTSKNKGSEEMLKNLYQDNIRASGLNEIQERLNNLLMIPEYNFSEERFIQAIFHEGRKYKRLYLNKEIVNLFRSKFPELMDHLGVSNGDMFSNIVADVLKVYRMGFADAFSVMFNKLIDFTIENSISGSRDFSRETHIKIVQEKADVTKNDRVEYGYVKDGNLFEPLYKRSSTSVAINNSHPFNRKVSEGQLKASEVLEELTLIMATIENESLRENEKRFLEIFRQKISRSLRLRIEEQTVE